MYRFLHLGVRPEGTYKLDDDAIEAVLNKAKDWYRYAPNCWIIYTGKNADVWYDRLKVIPELQSKTSFFLCEVNLGERAGWMPSKFWEWISKSRA